MIKPLMFLVVVAFMALGAPTDSEGSPIEDIRPPVNIAPQPVTESEALKDTLAAASAPPRGPQEVLRDYEAGMAFISQQFSAMLGSLVQAVHKGELSREEAEIISGEQYQAARMQFELLSALHEILQQDIARAAVAPPAPVAEKQNEIVMMALPFSSLELSPSLVEYLGLSPDQITAIEKVMSEEHRTLEPLMAQMQANKTKLLAVSGHSERNEKEVKGLAATQAAMMTKLILANSRMKTKIYKLLSAAQQEKLDILERSSDLDYVPATDSSR